MDADNFNMSIRKFLKMVGVSSQHEIEQSVAKAITEARLKGDEKLPVKMTLKIAETGLNIDFDGVIELN